MLFVVFGCLTNLCGASNRFLVFVRLTETNRRFPSGETEREINNLDPPHHQPTRLLNKQPFTDWTDSIGVREKEHVMLLRVIYPLQRVRFSRYLKNPSADT